MLVGSSIGNNSEYLRNTSIYSTRIFAAGCAVQACPSFTRPFLGRLLRIFTNRYGSKLKCNIIPAYQAITQNIADKSSSLDAELETTYLRYFLEGYSSSSRSNQASLDTVVTSILGLNGAAQEQLKVAIPALILNLLSADASANIVQLLLDEVRTAVSSSKNTDIASAVFTADRLPVLDSCLRETLRLHGLDLLTMKRRLMADIKFDDTLTLPKGCPIAIASYTVHRDETHYPNAEIFDPFRFCEKIPNSNSYKSTRPSYEPDEHYLVFGIGHHVSHLYVVLTPGIVC
ncbi:hypothetical protein LTR64_005796 [Lithohypha guttulata]|uniref:uncharacterized protein n=1 Tax=Lithohypha guttulata TaxID=1690604 RepID=UPI00315DF694